MRRTRAGGVYIYRRERRSKATGKQLVRWVVEHRTVNDQGLATRSVRVFDREHEAGEEADRIRAQFGRGISATSRATVATLWKRYSVHARPRLSPGTFETYSILYARHVEPILGGREAASITRETTREFISELLAKGLSVSTVRGAVNVLRLLLGQLVDQNALAFNAASIKRRSLPRQDHAPKSLTREQAAAFQRAAQGDKYEALALFLLLTGVRIGEALALRFSDIDWERRQVLVSRSARRGREGLVKTQGSRRRVAIHPYLAKLLKARSAEAVSDLVFPARDGRSFMASCVAGDAVDRIAQRAGIGHVSCHQLRHTFATLALGAGQPLKLVASALGHSDPGLTSRVYANAEMSHDGLSDKVAELVELPKVDEAAAGD